MRKDLSHCAIKQGQLLPDKVLVHSEGLFVYKSVQIWQNNPYEQKKKLEYAAYSSLSNVWQRSAPAQCREYAFGMPKLVQEKAVQVYSQTGKQSAHLQFTDHASGFIHIILQFLLHAIAKCCYTVCITI